MSNWLKVMAREQSWARDPGGLVPSLPMCQRLPACLHNLLSAGCSVQFGGQQKPLLDEVRKVCWGRTTSWTSAEASEPSLGLEGQSGLGVPWEIGL